MEEPLRVLVVDDSLLYRRIVREALSGIPGVTVVGSAENGRVAMEKIPELRPDLVTLDLEMPEVDGLGVLRWLRQQRLTTRAVMLSAASQAGAAATMQALQEGALDFVAKPSSGNAVANLDELSAALRRHVETLKFLLRCREKTALRTPVAAASHSLPTPAPIAAAAGRTFPRNAEPPRRAERVRIVCIGVSTGGPDALSVMLPKLPATLRVPVLVVQHMPPVFTKSLAESLDRRCPLKVREAEDRQPVKAGEILIAPGGRQMKIDMYKGEATIRLTDDPPVQSCRPSVDYLFESVVEGFGGGTLGVIMTGMGYDGSEGCRRIASAGGRVIAQDEASCVVFGMPRKPVQEGVAQFVVPLSRLAEEITRHVGLQVNS